MKRTNFPWAEASHYEVCGDIEFRYGGRVYLLRCPNWVRVERVWRLVV